MKKSKGKGKRFLKLLPWILCIVLSVILIISAAVTIGSVGTIVAVLEETIAQEQEARERERALEAVKLNTATQIIAMRSMFENAIDEAIEDAECLDLEDQKEAIIAWMMAICAASTENWTKNTQRNIMGVSNFPKDGTPQQSVQMAAELIVSLYKELTAQSGDGTFSVEDFKTEFGLDPLSYVGIARVKYAFDNGLQFGYTAPSTSYSSDSPIANEEQAYSIQKMCLFTACYFLGDTSIAKWAALSLNENLPSGSTVYGDGTMVNDDSTMSGDPYYSGNYEGLGVVNNRKYWNESLLNSYEKLLENKVRSTINNNATSAVTTITDTTAIVDTLAEQGQGVTGTPQQASTDYFETAIFIGDSRIEGLGLYEGGILKGATFFAKPGSNSSGLAIADVEVNGKTEHLGPYLEEHDFRKVYIMCGINSMGYPLESNVRMFKEDLLDLVLEKLPDAKIYILSDLGATKEAGTNNPALSKDRVSAYNEELKKLANGQNIVYLDVASQFQDSEGWLDSSVSDGMGVHLKASECQKLARYLAANTYGESKLIEINYDLILKVYSYYNAYKKSVMTSGMFSLPFSKDYEYLVTRPADVDDKFGFGRDAISDSNGNSSTGGATPHRGYDIPLGYGTALYACCDGYISEAEFGTPDGWYPTTAGMYITITSEDGAYSFDYFHLSAIADGLQWGTKVKKGQLVAYSGNSSAGYSTWGAHFHFGVIDRSDNRYIDPLIILSNGAYFSTNIGNIDDTSLFAGRWDIKIIDEMPDWFSRPVYDSDTVRWLAAIIWGEAGNQPMEGKVAVGIVVMNRFEQWKDNYGYETVYDVITQGNGVQFNPAMPGHSFWTALESYDAGTLDQDCIEAAILAANGQKIIYYDGYTYDFSDIMFFANVGYKDRPGVINIGDHGFANYIYWD